VSRRLLIVLACAVVVLSACKVDGSVTVHVNDDGSGVVVARVALDRGAVQAAEVGGAKLEDAVRLGDLTAAGWRSTGWRRSKDGGTTLTLTKGFAQAQDASAVVAELNGPDGPLRRVRVTRSSSTFTQSWAFSGVADLKDEKTGVTSDQELVGRLTAQRVDVAALDQQLLLQERGALRLHVTADLPHASPHAFPVRTGRTTVMHTTSSDTAVTRIVALLLGLAVAVVALLVLFAGGLRSRRRGRA
jgi:hypothetical protein